MPAEKKAVSVSCVSWPGALVSAAIVLARAFQPGAVPVETWSAKSWILTLLPMAVPAIAWVIGAVAALLVALAWWLFTEKRR